MGLPVINTAVAVPEKKMRKIRIWGIQNHRFAAVRGWGWGGGVRPHGSTSALYSKICESLINFQLMSL